jgi:site-specific recombinase XerD
VVTSLDPNFSEVIERFEKALRGRNLQPQTVHAYLADAIQFLTWLEETRAGQPETVTASIAHTYLEYLITPTADRPGGYSASTISRKIKSLRYFYDSLDES